MRTAVAPLSIESFYSTPPSTLQRREAEIMVLFGPKTRLSRQQISEIAHMKINCVTGRVNSLLAKGALIEEGFRVDPYTRKRQSVLRLPTGQLSLI